MRISDWSSDVCSSDLLPRKRERRVNAPQRTARVAAGQRRLAGAGITFRPLPRAVDAQHEKGKSPRSDALEGGQPVRDLLIARAEAPLEQQQVVARRITVAPESYSRHQARHSVVWGKSVVVRVDLGGRRHIDTKKLKTNDTKN